MMKALYPVLCSISILFILSTEGCSSCRKESDPEIRVASNPLTLEMTNPVKEPDDGSRSKIKRIEIGPSKRKVVEEASPVETVPAEVAAAEEGAYKTANTSLPPDTFEESDLTERLRQKMTDAYAGREQAVPDVKIYLSEMNYDDFVGYYNNLGYHVNKVAVPAREVIEPVLEQRPELAGKINLADYDNVVIHQVMIDDAGISAADKYIDPDTFEIVNKTFVTKMNKE